MSDDPRVKRISLLLQKLEHLDGQLAKHPGEWNEIARAIVAELDKP